MKFVTYLLLFIALGAGIHLSAFEQLNFPEHNFTIQIPNNTSNQALNKTGLILLAEIDSGLLSINSVRGASLVLNDQNALADYKSGFEFSNGVHVGKAWLESVNGQQFFVISFTKGTVEGVRYTTNGAGELLILTYTKPHDKYPPDCDKNGIVFFQSFRFIK